VEHFFQGLEDCQQSFAGDITPMLRAQIARTPVTVMLRHETGELRVSFTTAWDEQIIVDYVPVQYVSNALHGRYGLQFVVELQTEEIDRDNAVFNPDGLAALMADAIDNMLRQRQRQRPVKGVRNPLLVRMTVGEVKYETEYILPEV
jgi:hypothetical protein